MGVWRHRSEALHLSSCRRCPNLYRDGSYAITCCYQGSITDGLSLQGINTDRSGTPDATEPLRGHATSLTQPFAFDRSKCSCIDGTSQPSLLLTRPRADLLSFNTRMRLMDNTNPSTASTRMRTKSSTQIWRLHNRTSGTNQKQFRGTLISD
jgi:hypothetical protein